MSADADRELTAIESEALAQAAKLPSDPSPSECEELAQCAARVAEAPKLRPLYAVRLSATLHFAHDAKSEVEEVAEKIGKSGFHVSRQVETYYPSELVAELASALKEWGYLEDHLGLSTSRHRERTRAAIRRFEEADRG